MLYPIDHLIFIQYKSRFLYDLVTVIDIWLLFIDINKEVMIKFNFYQQPY